MKKTINIVFIILAILFLVLLFVFKGTMNTFVSNKMKEQASEDIQKNMAMYVDSAFNYMQNGKGFRMTFLEFGSTRCINCKRMEKVIEEVKVIYPHKVNVKFIDILLPEYQDVMKYFGIAAIPTQVLMDSSGKEIFRHTGYFSFDDLDREFQKIRQ